VIVVCFQKASVCDLGVEHCKEKQNHWLHERKDHERDVMRSFRLLDRLDGHHRRAGKLDPGDSSVMSALEAFAKNADDEQASGNDLGNRQRRVCAVLDPGVDQQEGGEHVLGDLRLAHSRGAA